MHLPAPPAAALALSAQLTRLIAAEIERGGGWLSFARYMELALYAPGLGYYMAGARKLGRDGDFVTAPEISRLFGRTLARQLKQLAGLGLADILEIGAGSGTLAVDLLLELERLGHAPARYWILDLSPDLRDRSRDTLAERAPHLLERVAWLNQLPSAYTGIVIGNEVLDAMPARVFRRDGGAVLELGVTFKSGKFEWAERSQLSPPDVPDPACFPTDGYRSEVQFVARAFVRSLGHVLSRGVALFFDYGFPRHEYYHPQRSGGTLMCHYRHRAHDDPFFLPGLQDITTHVDFSAVAQAGRESQLDLLGYTNQAQFLVNCGITDVLAETPAEDAARYAPQAAQAQKLLSPAEMGELFKVIALGKGVKAPLIGFSSGDRSHTLQAMRTDEC
ncbi:MAG: SAM-dependent methyltransferase [Betaproteobacteria bacterium]|nr:SAM-dependent methyltransferase [Betaproteobacteria bacterium]